MKSCKIRKQIRIKPQMRQNLNKNFLLPLTPSKRKDYYFMDSFFSRFFAPKKQLREKTELQKSQKMKEIIKIKDVLLKKLQNVGNAIFNLKHEIKPHPLRKKKENRNFIWITFFVLKFVKILKAQTSIRLYKKLNSRNFGLINDHTKWVEDAFIFHSKLSMNSETFHIKVSFYHFFYFFISLNKSNFYEIFSEE